MTAEERAELALDGDVLEGDRSAIVRAVATAIAAALASERAAMLAHVEIEAKCYREHGLDGAESALGIVANWLRARATSPAPEPVAAAERAVADALAATRGRP